MNWWGKVIGGAAGFVLGGPIFALLGATIGHQVDEHLPALRRPRGQTRTQTSFLNTTFAVMGHLCKTDGRVSEVEIAMANKVMGRLALNATQRRAAMVMFRDGKQPGFRLGDALTQLRADCGRYPVLLSLFLEIQIVAALADGGLSAQEETTLRFICVRLGVPGATYEELLRAARADNGDPSSTQPRGSAANDEIDDAYGTLGVAANASDADIKQAYRRLLSQHHPDKLAAAGLSEEMMQLANEKTLRIRRAYEHIQSKRGAA